MISPTSVGGGDAALAAREEWLRHHNHQPQRTAVAAAMDNTKKEAHQQSDFLRHFIAGAVGGSAAATLLSPLDIVRTRLQSAGSVKMRPDRLIAHIFRTEGFFAFYRGLVPTVLGVGPSRAMYFGFFSSMKRRLAQEPLFLSNTSLHLASAAVAGFATNTLMSPWWVIRLRLQLQSTPVVPFWVHASRWMAASTTAMRGSSSSGGSGGAAHAAVPSGSAAGLQGFQLRTTPFPVAAAAAVTAAAGGISAGSTAARVSPPVHPPGQGYTGVLDCFRRILREEGARTFYRGLMASYLGVFETALQFALYGFVKERITARQYEATKRDLERRRAATHGPSSAAALAPIDPAEISRAAYSSTAAFVNSGLTKLLASVVTYPHEVIRTRLREQRADNIRYNGIVHACVTVAREEGLRGLYGGMSVHLLRTVPNAAILVLVVEHLVDGSL